MLISFFFQKSIIVLKKSIFIRLSNLPCYLAMPRAIIKYCILWRLYSICYYVSCRAPRGVESSHVGGRPLVPVSSLCSLPSTHELQCQQVITTASCLECRKPLPPAEATSKLSGMLGRQHTCLSTHRWLVWHDVLSVFHL